MIWVRIIAERTINDSNNNNKPSKGNLSVDDENRSLVSRANTFRLSRSLETKQIDKLHHRKSKKIARMDIRHKWRLVLVSLIAALVGTNLISKTFFSSRTLMIQSSVTTNPVDTTRECIREVTNDTTTDVVCTCLAQWTAGKIPWTTPAFALWQSLETQIREAAFGSLGDCWIKREDLQALNATAFHNLLGRMFASLDPFRLRKSMKARSNPLVMEKVLEVILKRLADSENNPPLMVAVFGGSVTEGCESVGSLGPRVFSDSSSPCKDKLTLASDLLHTD